MRKKGFTLVELLAVIAILAILVIIAMPNVLDMFNKAKQDAFETEVKTHVKAVSNQFITTGQLVYSNVVDGAAKLPMDGEELDYYIVVDSRGNIKELNVTNGDYKIEATGSSSAPIKVEQIGDTIKSEVAKSGEEFAMNSNGDITGDSLQDTPQIVKNLNISWSRENLFNIGKTISTYNSSKQTPEDFFNAALDSDWDYDVNYYKLSNTPVGSNSTFYVETVINGITIKDYLYKEQVTMSGTLFDIYYIVHEGSTLPYLLNNEVDKSYVYSGTDKVVNLSKGLWFIDFLGATVESSDNFTIKEATYNVKVKTVDGHDYIKVSNDTIKKEDLIGKKLSLVGHLISGDINEEFDISEESITQDGSNIILEGSLMIVPNDGCYVPAEAIHNYLDFKVVTK